MVSEEPAEGFVFFCRTTIRSRISWANVYIRKSVHPYRALTISCSGPGDALLFMGQEFAAPLFYFLPISRGN